MSNSWKQYGGINNFNRAQDITTNSIVCNDLTVRNAYKGDFVIDGNLDVSGNGNFSGTLTADQIDISGGIIYHDLSINGDLQVTGNEYLYHTLYFGINKPSFLTPDQSTTLLGLNTASPQATLDISGNTQNSLYVHSDLSMNRNIITQNEDQHGLAVQTSSTTTSIQFYQDNTMPLTYQPSADAQLTFTQGGIFELDASHTNIITKLAIAPPQNQTTGHIFNETAIIQDTSNNVFLPDIYENQTVYEGNALSLVTTDDNSVTFCNLTTPNTKTGMRIGGGAYPPDATRSFGTLGYQTVNTYNEYMPVQTMVSGTNPVTLPATTGFNTYNPRIDQYAVDINGPLHIGNGRIVPTVDVSFQVIQSGSTSFSPSANLGITVGTPITFGPNYVHNLIYTQDYGLTWTETTVVDPSSDLNSAENDFLVVDVVDSNYAVLAGVNGFMYYTWNGGQDWARINLTSPSVIPSITNMHIAPNGPNLRVFFDYYTLPSFTFYMAYYDLLIADLDGTPIVTAATSIAPLPSVVDLIGITNNDTTIFVVGGQSGYEQIIQYDYSLNETIPRFDLTSPPGFISAITVYGSNDILAVGFQTIVYSHDGGASWTYNSSYPYILQAVSIYDSQRAIAIGGDGSGNHVIVYSSDGFVTWQEVPTEVLNGSGNASTLINSLILSSISFIDLNTISITAIKQFYNDGSTYGQTTQYLLYIPALFSNTTTTVLDISGSVIITGNIDVQTETVIDISLNGQIFINNNVNINTGVSDDQGPFNVAIGIQAGEISQSGYGIAMGYQAAQYQQNPAAIAIGANAGQTGQGQNSIAIGTSAAQVQQRPSAIAIGYSAGEQLQQINSIAIGAFAAQNLQQGNAIAIGTNAGQANMSTNAIAIGYSAGANAQQWNAVAIGYGAGQSNLQSGCIALGYNAGNNNNLGANSIAIGVNAGLNSLQTGAIAIGFLAGTANMGTNAIALGQNAGSLVQGQYSLAVGYMAGNNLMGQNSIALGQNAGAQAINQYAVAIGTNAGQTNMSQNSIAIGQNSGALNMNQNSISIGQNAGQTNMGQNSVAIGLSAGALGMGDNAIAIGENSGDTSQPANSIILNASGSSLNAVTTGLFINPIRQVLPAPVSHILAYDTVANEICDVQSLSLDGSDNLSIGGNAIILGQYASIGYPSPSYTYNLDISGNARAEAFNATSDYRIKANLVPLAENPQFSVDELRPYYYYNTRTKRDDVGFLAHELAEIYPFLVTGVKDDPTSFQSINYNGVIGILVKEIQDLKQQMRELQDKSG